MLQVHHLLTRSNLLLPRKTATIAAYPKAILGMEIRSVKDAVTALLGLLKPLRRAMKFGDLILADNIFDMKRSAVRALSDMYMCESLERRLNGMVCTLQRSADARLPREVGSALARLLTDGSLNFYQTANRMQHVVAAPASGSSSARAQLIASTVERLPGFQAKGQAAFDVVAQMERLLERYAQGGYGGCRQAPIIPASILVGEDTALATRGSRATWSLEVL